MTALRGLVVAFVIVISCAGLAGAQSCPAPRTLVDTPVGLKYCADPAFATTIDAGVTKIRQDVRAQRQAGRLIIYASTPISPRVIDPGVYQLPKVDGKDAGGSEYMVMWTRVLGGDDGAGRDIDTAHFTGPADMRAFFRCGPEDVTGCLGRWLDARSATDAELRRVAGDTDARRAFVRYYALRASTAYSAGAHDEWNIFVRINRKRTLGDQIAIFFEGRSASPAEMETEISPGYEAR